MRLIPIAMMSLFGFFVGSQALPQSRSEELGRNCLKGLEQCVAEKRVEWAERGTLGMRIQSLDDDAAHDQGGRWVVDRVLPNGPAQESGLAIGDVLVEWNGEKIRMDDSSFFVRELEAIRIGDKVKVRFLRAGKAMAATLTAKGPEPMTFEYWLLFYVQQNFSEEEFLEYEEKIKERFAG